MGTRNTLLLSLTNRSPGATDLGHLLHKHPARCHEVELAFGKGFVFYPKATADTPISWRSPFITRQNS